MNRILLVLSVALLLTGCYRPKNRTITVAVPQMKTQDCAARVVEAFKLGRPDSVNGVISAVPNVEKKTVDVTFESLVVSIKNVQFTIAKAGFDADEVPADPQARAALPVDCR